jgi:hypothetical protein
MSHFFISRATAIAQAVAGIFPSVNHIYLTHPYFAAIHKGKSEAVTA